MSKRETEVIPAETIEGLRPRLLGRTRRRLARRTELVDSWRIFQSGRRLPRIRSSGSVSIFPPDTMQATLSASLKRCS